MTDKESITQQYEISKEKIIANKQSLCPKLIGIYFLIKDFEIVYIGQSVNIMIRISQHAQEQIKEFDSFSIIECPVKYLASLEAHFIYKFRPRLNSSLPVNQIYKSFQQVKKIHDLPAPVLKLWMKHNFIENDKDALYCLSDFDGIVKFKYWIKEHHPNISPKQCSVDYMKQYIREINKYIE